MKTNYSFITKHGVLIEVMGQGVLILGKSGIGKSKCALELISRGHKLVSDDVVVIDKASEGRLKGKAPETIKHLLEVRDQGIINVKELYGNDSVSDENIIYLVVDLIEKSSEVDEDISKNDKGTYNILGVDLPYTSLSVNLSNNIAIDIEQAVRNKTAGLST